MAQSEDVIALIHDLSSAGLAVTVIGAPTRSSKDARSTEHSESNSPTREPAEEKGVTKEDDGKKQKYSTMAAEVYPTRDREVLRKKLSKKVDVRYLSEIKTFKDKIKSSYLVSCNQNQCPMIQERLNQHVHDHHRHHHRKADNACGTRTKSRDQAINVSPTLSRMRLPKFTFPLSADGRPVQTEITMRDFSPNRLFVAKNLSKMTSDILDKDIPLRRSETREVLPKRNFYKEHLQNEILNWLQNVPMFYTLNLTTKDIKENIVNNLVEKINRLSVEADERSYEIKTKIEIENCLSRLPMWLPVSKRDQTTFKENLREKLWSKIQDLNENFLGIVYEKTAEYENEEDKVKCNESYEKEIADWSLRLQLTNQFISRHKVVDLLSKRLSPLLKIPLHTTSYKLILKGEIIDILDDLPLILTSPKYRTVHLNRYAEELANRLLSIQIKHEASSSKIPGRDATVYHEFASQVLGMPVPMDRYNLKKIIVEIVSECLNKVQVCHREDLYTEIYSSFMDTKGHLRTVDETIMKNEICTFLRDTGKLSPEKTDNIAKTIMKKVKDALKHIKNSVTTSFDSVIPQLSGTISVYRWGDRLPTTSTPKKPSKKEIPKLNAEEISYTEKVADIIRSWMDTLPKQYNEDKNFKETIINDLAGDIMDERKLEQLAPDTMTDKDKLLNYLMYRWLYRYEFFEDDTIRDDAKPYIADFLKRLENISVPQLTAPQHGTRQAMANIQHMQGELGWKEDYLAKGIDVLEDQISVWMNEQPSEIYDIKDKGKRDKMVHDLALTLQDRLRNKSPETEIDKDINQWLQKVVKPVEREHIGLLTQNLKEKVVDVPQDQTLEGRHEDKKRYLANKLAAKKKLVQQESQPTQDVSNIGNIEGDPDKTIREFIAKYIQHHYDIDDPMARGAFSHLLKTELRKLSPPSRKEVYDNFDKSIPNKQIATEVLKNELEYIKTISDWLKNIPIDASYNTTGNKDRIEFINDLARNIQEIEEQRIQSPNEMDYNYLIASLILQSMQSYSLPILPEHKDNTPLMANQLLQKLVAKRSLEPQYASQPSPSGNTQSLDISDIKEQNLNEFITDYIRVNGRDIADDEMKLEAWTARLLKEYRKMLHEGADPSTLCKAKVYSKFSEVPFPTDESVRRFSLELAYVKEITDWLKNLPLLPMDNQPEAEEERIKMISELAEKMSDNEVLRVSDPINYTDKQIDEYIANWISRLPIDPQKEIVVPIVIQQLKNRMEKLDKRNQSNSEKPRVEESRTSTEPINNLSLSDDKKVKGTNERKNTRKYHSKSIDKKQSTASINNKGSTDKGLVCLKFCKDKNKQNPAVIIVEAIENWSKKLPIKGDDKEAVKSMKEDIARKLYQKIGELNVDPRIFNDDLLYRDMLGDEIDTQLENVPQNPELQKNRDNLKDGLLNTILDTKKIIKEKSAGDNYKHKLETTIDASIPNPVQSTQVFDPGFEIYKIHLASMFILENFDHANDHVKMKYENRIRSEIDKYFESAQNKNALPLAKEQIYNELYSALFKVPMPSEKSVIDEVEQIKTRCEIDVWFEGLPLKETDGVHELLEWDTILSVLAKRIHEIEKSLCSLFSCSADKEIHKEIMKWVEKLPLLPGHEGIDVYANRLQNILKSTAEARKYVSTDYKGPSKGKGKKIKENKENSIPNTSQVAGPSSAVRDKVSQLPSLPQSKATNAKPCCTVSPMSQKKPGDIIVEVVEDWCNQIPLTCSEENNRLVRDNLSTRIIIQISELNMDPEIFNDDALYDELLDEELENVLSNLPVCSDFQQCKAAKKHQLKETIKSIKPLIKAEKSRHEYKEELLSTVDNILKKPQDTTGEKVALFNKLKNEIVENFVQYNYNKDDVEGKQVYKMNVHDAVMKYFTHVKEIDTNEQVDPLVRRNQLLSELGKIPIPHGALTEEVEEIKMRNEIEQFFQELSIPEGDTENKMIKNLSKRLYDIEKSGHNCTNEKKMKSEIARCLKKLNKDVDANVVEDFVGKLKNNETERKMLPLTSSQAANLNQSGYHGSDKPRGTGSIKKTPVSDTTPFSQQKGTFSQGSNQTGGEEQWISLLPATPPSCLLQDTGYSVNHQSYDQQYRPEVWNPNTDAVNQSLGQSNLDYEGFHGGGLFSSSVAADGYAVPIQNSGQPAGNCNGFESGAILSSPVAHNLNQNHRSIRETPPSPVGTQPNYGQIVTPRQVAQSPQQVAQYPAQNVTTSGNVTPESLFEAPVFQPVPFHCPLPVPIIEADPGFGSTAPTPPSLSQNANSAVVPSSRGLATPPTMPDGDDRGPREFETSDEDELPCRCDRYRRGCRGLPLCMLSMEEYFDDCYYNPMWCRLHFPECFYY